jgi:hypothetical protein
MRTFYEASATEEDIGGGVAAAATAWRTAQSTSALAPFAVAHAAGRPAAARDFSREKLSAILRARAAGGGERDRSAGTSEHTDRASHLLRRERERERVLLSEQEWPSAERERVVLEGEDTDEITTCVFDVRKKATLGGNQRRRILQACVSSTKLSMTDFIARYQYGSDQ